MNKLFFLAALLYTNIVVAAQDKISLAQKVVSSAHDFREIKPIEGILKNIPSIYAYIPHLHPLGEQSYRVSSAFGDRIDPINGSKRFHAGIDLASKYACKVYATASGKVIFSGERGGYGKCIILQHKYGFTSYYAHLTHLYVKSKSNISAGDVIGFVGSTGRSTGNHLHYEVRKNGRAINPILK